MEIHQHELALYPISISSSRGVMVCLQLNRKDGIGNVVGGTVSVWA